MRGAYPAALFITILGLTGVADAQDEPATIRIIARDAIVRTDMGEARARTVEVHDVHARGERTRLLVQTVDNPAAVAVLFAGGKGATQLSEDGVIGWGSGNFVVRSRPLFMANGIATAVFDAPTDEPYDLTVGFRGSADHATDIGAVIAHLRKTFKLPVWLVGTSRGTNSVASAAARLKTDKPDGIVLTASMLAYNERGGHLFDYDLGAIEMPVLIAHHVDDECRVTPPGEVETLAARLKKANPLKVLLYEGGSATGNECHARHYHGFHGIEEQVVADIAAWIKAPSN